jgi:hypothetical protein
MRGGIMSSEHLVKIVINNGPVRDSTTTGTVGANKHTINLYPSPDNAPMADILAHELGHVIGRIFATPANEGDPRTISAKNHVATIWQQMAEMFGVTEAEARGMYGSEKEAWDYARKMWPIRRESEEFALGTYEKTL